MAATVSANIKATATENIYWSKANATDDDPKLQLIDEYVSKVRDWVPRRDESEPPIGLTRLEKARQEEMRRQQKNTATAPPTIRKRKVDGNVPENPRFIPEWGEMQGVLIRYPLGISTHLVKAMSERAKIFCLVDEKKLKEAKKTLRGAGILEEDIEWILEKTDTYWIRDYGPWFVSTASSSKGIAIVDHEYDCFKRKKDNKVPKMIAEALDVPYYDSELVGAGGNMMVDGTGRAVATHTAYTQDPACETWDETSVPLESCKYVDNRMEDYFGIQEFQVVADPTGTYIDHVDCWAKFLSPTTILIREVSKDHPQYEDIEKVVRYFESTKTSEGQPWKIARVWTDADQPYTNSLILNGEVFVPIVDSKDDEAALEAYRAAMPDYEVSGWYGYWEPTDALHCRTIAIPKF